MTASTNITFTVSLARFYDHLKDSDACKIPRPSHVNANYRKGFYRAGNVQKDVVFSSWS